MGLMKQFAMGFDEESFSEPCLVAMTPEEMSHPYSIFSHRQYALVKALMERNIPIEDRTRYVNRLYAIELSRGLTMTLDIKMLAQKSVYRITTYKNSVSVVYLGFPAIDSDLEGVYPSVSALPDWMQERLAVLSVMSSDPPTTEVEGIGRRIDEFIYWVFPVDASTSA